MNHKLAKGKKVWKWKGETTTLLFSLKELEILHQERREQMKTIVMKHFNGNLFHKFEPANKQHTNQSINKPILLCYPLLILFTNMFIYVLFKEIIF